jgi:hypothetical protein
VDRPHWLGARENPGLPLLLLALAVKTATGPSMQQPTRDLWAPYEVETCYATQGVRCGLAQPLLTLLSFSSPSFLTPRAESLSRHRIYATPMILFLLLQRLEPFTSLYSTKIDCFVFQLAISSDSNDSFVAIGRYFG